MGGGIRTSSKSNAPRRSSHLKVSPNDVDVDVASSENLNKKKDGSHSSKKQHRNSSRRSSSGRKNRVHPAMLNNNDDGLSSSQQQQQQRRHKKNPNLTVDTNGDDSPSSCPTPSGVRGSRDLRSPGVPKSPMAGAPAKSTSKTSTSTPTKTALAIPDFCTQTDASGNATTPRSAQAVEKARATSKVYPSRRENEEGNASDNSSTSSKDMMEETCDTIVDSFRMMCCCLTNSEIEQTRGSPKSISDKETQDSDDNNVDNTKSSSHNNNIPKLLGSIHPHDTGKKCLVLDLDETLVHSSFRAVEGADFVIPVQIEDVVHFVYVAKRPGVDEFLLEMAKHYEIVIYTASLNKYADPLLDLLDPHKTIRYRLFRESCVFFEGNYVKDLSVLDRDLSKTIIIDNSPNSYLFHPENAIDCSSFIDDPRDRELDQIGSFLAGIKHAKDVRGLAPQWKDWPVINPHEMEDQPVTKTTRRRR